MLKDFCSNGHVNCLEHWWLSLARTISVFSKNPGISDITTVFNWFLNVIKKIYTIWFHFLFLQGNWKNSTYKNWLNWFQHFDTWFGTHENENNKQQGEIQTINTVFCNNKCLCIILLSKVLAWYVVVGNILCVKKHVTSCYDNYWETRLWKEENLSEWTVFSFASLFNWYYFWNHTHLVSSFPCL